MNTLPSLSANLLAEPLPEIQFLMTLPSILATFADSKLIFVDPSIIFGEKSPPEAACDLDPYFFPVKGHIFGEKLPPEAACDLDPYFFQ